MQVQVQVPAPHAAPLQQDAHASFLSPESSSKIGSASAHTPTLARPTRLRIRRRGQAHLALEPKQARQGKARRIHVSLVGNASPGKQGRLSGREGEACPRHGARFKCPPPGYTHHLSLAADASSFLSLSPSLSAMLHHSPRAILRRLRSLDRLQPRLARD